LASSFCIFTEFSQNFIGFHLRLTVQKLLVTSTPYKCSYAKKKIAGAAGYVKIFWYHRWTFRQVKLMSYLLTAPNIRNPVL